MMTVPDLGWYVECQNWFGELSKEISDKKIIEVFKVLNTSLCLTSSAKTMSNEYWVGPELLKLWNVPSVSDFPQRKQNIIIL